MLREALLAYVHISAVLLLAVFLTARTALTRVELLGGGAAAVGRLRRLDTWLWVSFAAVALSGVLRAVLGAKGLAWYAANPLLWAKVALLAVMAAMSLPAAAELRHWAAASEPVPAEVARARKRLMWQAHLMAVPPLLGCLLAYGL